MIKLNIENEKYGIIYDGLTCKIIIFNKNIIEEADMDLEKCLATFIEEKDLKDVKLKFNKYITEYEFDSLNLIRYETNNDKLKFLLTKTFNKIFKAPKSKSSNLKNKKKKKKTPILKELTLKRLVTINDCTNDEEIREYFKKFKLMLTRYLDYTYEYMDSKLCIALKYFINSVRDQDIITVTNILLTKYNDMFNEIINGDFTNVRLLIDLRVNLLNKVIDYSK